MQDPLAKQRFATEPSSAKVSQALVACVSVSCHIQIRGFRVTYDTGSAGGGAKGPWAQQQYQPRLGKVTLLYAASMSSHSRADKNLRCRQRSCSGGSACGVGDENPTAATAARVMRVGTRILKELLV